MRRHLSTMFSLFPGFILCVVMTLVVPTTTNAALIGEGECSSLPHSPGQCNVAENVAALISGIDMADLTLLAESESTPLPMGLEFFDSLGDPVLDPFAADLKEGSVSWTGGFDYISIKNGTLLSVFSGDGGAFELTHGVSNIKVWSSSSAIPEPTAALVFATGFAVMGIARRRVA